MYNFLDTSLDKASKTLLKESKLSDIVDSSKLNTDIFYWKKNQDNIIKYCIQDAVLTKKLAGYFWDLIYEKMAYIPKRPFSKGKISEEYFLNRIWIPTINEIPREVLKYAYNSYSGGRFEILQRGYFPELWSYDIKSAYPAEIANLKDYTKGEWDKVRGEYHKDADGGFYRVNISVFEKNVSPVVQKFKNVLNIYPNGKMRLYLTKNEIEFIEKCFPKVYIEVIDGYEFMAHEFYYPFKKEIEYLYQWKETEKNPDIKYCVKIILNSLYGKTIQAVGGNTGKLFNPLYASEITANTRIKLLSLPHGNYDKVIAFSTDSVKSTIPLDVPNKPKLGDFELDFKGEGIYLMSDIYSFWNSETKKTKNKFRGFSLAVEKDYESPEEISLLKILDSIKSETEYTYLTKRVHHLGECLLHTHKRTMNDLNIFSVAEKKININGDSKRIWDRDFRHGYDVMKNTIRSKPLLVIE